MTLRIIAVVAALCFCLIGLTRAADTPPPVKNYFNFGADGLYFFTDAWSLRSDPGRGWVSLKVRGDEFLSATEDGGAFAFKDGESFTTRFPDHGNITHDQNVGRIGSVADGTYLLRVTPRWTRPAAELYVGFNAEGEQKLIMYLGDDVAFVRMGSVEREGRTWWQQLVRPDAGGLTEGQGALLVHESGRAVAINAPCSAGAVPTPDGASAFGLIFDVKGFAANSIPLAIEPEIHQESFVYKPGFDVTSSDDPDKKTLGATRGVINPIYGPDTKLDFNIEFGWLADRPFDGAVELDVRHAIHGPHFYERKTLEGVKPDENGRLSVHFDPEFDMPGVSDVWGRIVDADGRVLWVSRYRMAWDWPSYEPEIRVQPDMKEFWDATLAELRDQPLDVKVKRVFEDHPVLEVYEVSYTGLGGERVYAAIYVPKGADKPLPAIVGSHPGSTDYGIKKNKKGLYGSRIRQDLRFVTIKPFLRNKPGEDPGFNKPWWGPLGDRDDYVARKWYCMMVRAIDYLATRPDLVDMDRIVAAGGSQGGALALVTAALDDRVSYCFADCPSNGQPYEIMEYYGSFGPSKGAVPAGRTFEQVAAMLSYYNPVNFCPWIESPAYVGSNIGDLTVHSMGPLAAYHNLTALDEDQKAFYPGFTHFHGSGPGLHAKRKEIYEKIAGPPIEAKMPEPDEK